MNTINIPRSSLNPGQLKLLESTARVPLLCGGFGSGKTTALAIKFLQLKAANPMTPGLIVAPTYRMLHSITLMRLFSVLRKVLPPERMPKFKDKIGACYLDFGDGVPVYVRSASKPDLLDGLDVGWAVGDELRYWPKKSFEVFLGRLRVKCPFVQAACASTPDLNWMAEEFHYRRDPERPLIIAPTKENERNLAPGFIDNLRLSYSPRLQKVVIDGHFAILEGAVYDALDVDFWNSEYIKLFNPEDLRRQKVYLAVDPGYRKAAFLWIRQMSATTYQVFDQYMPDNTSDASAIDYINNKPWPIDEVWTDPAADNTQGAFGLDTLSMLQRLQMRSSDGIRYIVPPFRSITYGVDKVRSLLGDIPNGMKPRLFFSRDLKEYEDRTPRGIVKDLLAYRYPEMKNGRAISNEPLKDGMHDHANDALRYFIVGQYLSNEHLRQTDPAIDTEVLTMKRGKLGFRTIH